MAKEIIITTILADSHIGVMLSDSNISDGDRVWVGRKVWRCRGALIGFSGDYLEGQQFMKWWRGGCLEKHPCFKNSEALVLQTGSLHRYDGQCMPELIPSGIEAIGSGAKAAMCAYEALGFDNPKRAVEIVCKHDNGSRTPVRMYSL